MLRNLIHYRSNARLMPNLGHNLHIHGLLPKSMDYHASSSSSPSSVNPQLKTVHFFHASPKKPLIYDEYQLVGMLYKLPEKKVIQMIHAYALRTAQAGMRLENYLIRVYCEKSCVEDATKVFDMMKCVDLNTFKGLIFGFARIGKIEDALWARQRIHELKLIVTEAESLQISNYMIRLYSEKLCVEEAIKEFKKMKRVDLNTFKGLLFGFARLGRLDEALWSLQRIEELKFIVTEKDQVQITNSKIRMYSENSDCHKAKEVLDNMQHPNVTSYNELMYGYAKSGLWGEALMAFEEMKEKGLKPNDYTYLQLLSSFDHGGSVTEAVKTFKYMLRHHKPDLYHFSCMVDVLARGGLFRKAHEVIGIAEKMGYKKSTGKITMDHLYRTIAARCRPYGEYSIGLDALTRVVDDSDSIMLKALLLQEMGDQEAAEETRKKVTKKGEPGVSSIRE